jgi:hypothetical protein
MPDLDPTRVVEMLLESFRPLTKQLSETDMPAVAFSPLVPSLVVTAE